MDAPYLPGGLVEGDNFVQVEPSHFHVLFIYLVVLLAPPNKIIFLFFASYAIDAWSLAEGLTLVDTGTHFTALIYTIRIYLYIPCSYF
jgi:hypothetical protein